MIAILSCFYLFTLTTLLLSFSCGYFIHTLVHNIERSFCFLCLFTFGSLSIVWHVSYNDALLTEKRL